MEPKFKKCANVECAQSFTVSRSNKKYCSNICRSHSYQMNNFHTIEIERTVIKGIRENDKVLEKLFARLEKSKNYQGSVELSHDTLIGAGYNLSYCASTEYSEVNDKHTLSYDQLNFKLIYHPTEKNHYLICII